MIRNWKTEDGQYAGTHKNFIQNIERWISQGYTNPESCFVWVEDGALKGGIAYAAGEREAANILDFSLSPDSFCLGAELLAQSQKAISAQNVCYHLYNDSEHYGDYRKCFLDAGFLVTQEKLSYRYTGKSLENKTPSLDFRSCAEVGDKAFVEAVARVTRHTLDRGFESLTRARGPASAAEILFNELKQIEFQPDIWRLGYAGGRLIGLVVPSNFGEGYGGINYIGVVPAERGKGYVDALLYEGTRLLLQQGVTTVIADIDVLNHPMKNALERVGYHFSQEEVVLEKHGGPMA